MCFCKEIENLIIYFELTYLLVIYKDENLIMAGIKMRENE